MHVSSAFHEHILSACNKNCFEWKFFHNGTWISSLDLLKKSAMECRQVNLKTCLPSCSELLWVRKECLETDTKGHLLHLYFSLSLMSKCFFICVEIHYKKLNRWQINLTHMLNNIGLEKCFVVTKITNKISNFQMHSVYMFIKIMFVCHQ